MWFGDKALGLKGTVADVIHYCQLPKELGFQERGRTAFAGRASADLTMREIHRESPLKRPAL